MALNVEQDRLVKMKPGNEMLIRGVAGSGKTTVALHRALYLQLNYCLNKEDTVLLLTYNKALINYLNYIFKKIAKEHGHEYSTLYSKANRKVDKVNIDKMIRDQYMAIAGENKLEFVYYDEAVRRIFKECISEVKKDFKDVPLIVNRNSKFLIEEIDWIKSCNYLDINEYQNVDRIGRANTEKGNVRQRLAKHSKDRQAIFTLMHHFDKRMREEGYIYHRNAAIEVYKYSQNNPQKKYKHIIVDEGQDLSRVQLEYLKSIYHDGPDSSFTIVADTAQSIYPHAWLVNGRSFSSIGFDITGRSFSLTKNYRTSTQAAQAAYSMIANDPEIVGCEDYVPPSLLDQQGQYPVLREYDIEESESSGVYASIKKLLEQGYGYKDIAVIAREKKRLESMNDYLKAKNITCRTFTAQDDAFEKNCIQLMTMHVIKGLEFKVVFIITLNEGVIPHPIVNKQQETNERKLLYVGMTRAREQIFLSYFGKPSKFLMDIDHKYLRVSPEKRLKRFYKVAVDDYLFKNKIRHLYSREEEVRQWFARELNKTYRYPITMITFEQKLRFGSNILSCDLTVSTKHDGGLAPFIIVETKAPGVNLNDGWQQLQSYMIASANCRYCVITDGINVAIYNREFEPVDDLPVFHQSMRSYNGDKLYYKYLYTDQDFVLQVDYADSNYVAAGNGQKLEEYTGKDVRKVAIYERVAAGDSQIMDERMVDYFPLPAEWFNKNADLFITKVRGDSMINAGIDDGDLLVVEKQVYAENNDIVVALQHGDQAIVKQYEVTGKTVSLSSANPKYEAIQVRSDLVRILGKAIAVIKEN